MQNLKETQDKVYQEVKTLLQEFSTYSSEEDFIKNIEKVRIFSEKISELKIYQEINTIFSEQKEKEENIERQVINFEIDTKQIIDIQKDIEIIEGGEEKEVTPEENPISEKIDEEYFFEKEKEQNILTENLQEEVNNELSKISKVKEEIEKNEEEKRLHEERRRIVDISASHNITVEKTVDIEVSKEPKEIHESPHPSKKFKLSHIKGLNLVQSLFDDDHLVNIPEEPKIEIPKQNQSVVKSNMPIDYLEAEKSLPDFKLDINDKLAFTKMLFEGSQVELNQAVARLNSYKTLEEAKEYLSDLYYEKNWQKVDEYAQRLWSLVENKFL